MIRISHTPRRRSRALTLVELLVTMAIVALLTAIVMPNIIEAQERTKVVALRYDMRLIAESAQLFAADRGYYPVALQEFTGRGYLLSSQPRDRFVSQTEWPLYYCRIDQAQMPWMFDWGTGRYLSPVEVTGPYFIGSVGPDGDWWNRDVRSGTSPWAYYTAPWVNYDPTNGTGSRGNIFHTAKNSRGLDVPSTAGFF